MALELRRAIVIQDLECCLKLIDGRADVNCRDAKGNTPLMSAAMGGNVEVLLSLYISFRAQTCWQVTKLLVEYCANVHSTNDDGSIIMYTCRRVNAAFLCDKLLLGADCIMAAAMADQVPLCPGRP